MKKLEDIDFYLVTYSSISRNGTLSDVKNAVDAGCKIVQYREKNKNKKEMINEAQQLKKICENKAILLIDNWTDIAIAVNADGVHIGQKDISVEKARRILGNDKIIGLTVHNVEEAIKAEKLGVNYIGLAPIFKTDTKEDSGIPCGIEMIEQVRKKVGLPIIAVGGIDKNNVVDVIKRGADGVVAVYAVLISNDVKKEVGDIIKIIKEVKSI